MMREDGIEAPPPAIASDEEADTSASFTNLPFPMRQLPVLDPWRVTNFELAREIFLRAAGRLEVAKRDFPMDGIIHFKFL